MPIIEYFYSAHSAFAYLGSKRLLQMCADHGCRLRHRPINLGLVVEAVGGRPFAGRSQEHVDYYFGREIERWAEWRKVPIISYRPTYHSNPLELGNGLLIAAAEAGEDVDHLSHLVLEAHWREDADIADPVTLARIATSMGLDAEVLLAAAMSAPVQALHQRYTQEAINRSVFGSPTYFMNGDMFYGQDRLEMLERAITQPFRPTSWKNPKVAG
ncbi:MAG: 2-hydroxychromene-2-carboxylate isomerase [Paracoccaceae bacterium]|jgi:2-hydroxychromene-2-carboxylate isomerase